MKVGENMAKKTHEQFLKDMKEKGNPNVEIIGEYVDSKTPIKCQCKINSDHVWYSRPDVLLHYKSGCPYCNNKKVCLENSLGYNHPELIKYFKDKEEAFLYTSGSSKRVQLVCPECGTEKTLKVEDLVNYGFSCQNCSDGVSFPNKFIRNFLNMNNIDFISEWNPKWANNYRYDVMFKINNNIYICEMDGVFHKNENVIESDKIKNKLAEENNCIMIRVECYDSDPKYIYENMKKTILNELFDLENFDWIECAKRAEKSLFIKICNYINENKNITLSELVNKFQLGKTTINRYIKRGEKLKLINDRKKGIQNGNKIIVYKNNKEFKKYNSIRSLHDNMQNDLNKYLNRGTILKRLKKGNGSFEIDEYKIVQEEW